MRLIIKVDDQLVAEMDRRIGRKGRSPYTAALIRRALDRQRRWDHIEAAVGSVGPQGHMWGNDPAGWVRAERRAEPRSRVRGGSSG